MLTEASVNKHRVNIGRSIDCTLQILQHAAESVMLKISYSIDELNCFAQRQSSYRLIDKRCYYFYNLATVSSKLVCKYTISQCILKS